jgi:haloacetate dehalogenase
MAGDQVGLMRRLGFALFQLASHDRGAHVAHRLVLDHPSVVTRLAVLDILPTRHVLEHVTGRGRRELLLVLPGHRQRHP